MLCAVPREKRMDHDLLVLLGSVVGFLTACIPVVRYILQKIRSIEFRIVRAEDRVRAAWEFTLRRGELEAATKGLLDAYGNPTQAARDRFAALQAEIQTFYLDASHLPDHELVAEIESRWGGRIVAEVCKPLGIQSGACLVLAIKFARETMVVRTPGGTP